MTRALKVWYVSVGRDQAVVAAATKREAAHLVGHSLHSFNQYASTLDPDHRDAAVALARPNVGLKRPIDARDPVPWEVIPELRRYRPDKRETNAEKAARREARDAADAHAAETSRACRETLERLRPLLAELGVHPQTVKVGSGGIVLPAETVEMLVAKACELEELMST